MNKETRGSLMKNKKGFFMEILAFAVIGIIAILFFVGWMYGGKLVNNAISNVDMGNNSLGINVSYASSQTYGQLNTGYQAFPLIVMVLMVGYFIAGIIVAYYGRNNPILLFSYLIFTILLAIFSIYISNTYQDLENNSVLGSTMAQFTIPNFIMNNLPIFVLVMGLTCTLVGFILYKSQGEGL